MRYLLLTFVMMFVVGCDKVVSRDETVLSTERKEVDCTYTAPGICMDCGLSFDGSFSCAPKPKPFCEYSGHQDALVDTVEVKVVYESGKEVDSIIDRVKVTYEGCH